MIINPIHSNQIQIINNGFIPYYYQQEILDKIEDFYIGCLDIDIELEFNTNRRT